MEIYPHGKINLSFYITGRRPDGYHLVDTVTWPLGLFDYLRAYPGRTTRLSSPVKALETADNLVIRAWKKMQELYGIPSLHMYLEKGIPWEAGLGGGSGDAAAMLLLCNRLFELGLSREKLCEIGGELGADVPACLLDVPARGRGTGALVEPLETALELPLLILKPPGGFSTPAMYRAWDERGAKEADSAAREAAQEGLIRALKGLDIEALLPFLHNDFEEVLAGEERAVFEKARRLLAESGALRSHLCGSGSAVFGLYAEEVGRQEAQEQMEHQLPEGWQLLQPSLRLEREMYETGELL